MLITITNECPNYQNCQFWKSCKQHSSTQHGCVHSYDSIFRHTWLAIFIAISKPFEKKSELHMELLCKKHIIRWFRSLGVAIVMLLLLARNVLPVLSGITTRHVGDHLHNLGSCHRRYTKKTLKQPAAGYNEKRRPSNPSGRSTW